jgi:ABC-type branched-subunit amino acid transport system ATPase component
LAELAVKDLHVNYGSVAAVQGVDVTAGHGECASRCGRGGMK